MKGNTDFKLILVEDLEDNREDEQKIVNRWEWSPPVDKVFVERVYGRVATFEGHVEITLSNGIVLLYKYKIDPTGCRDGIAPFGETYKIIFPIKECKADVILDNFEVSPDLHESLLLAVLKVYEDWKLTH